MAESITPKKFFQSIKYTPTTKKTVCVICGNKIENSDYRRKLFHGENKTDHCFLIEKYLDITILDDTHTDTACRKCVREVNKIDETIKKLKDQYSVSLKKLYESHGQYSGSFKRRFAEESSAKSRKSLFQSDELQDITVTEKHSYIQVASCKSEKVYLVSEIHFPVVEALACNDYDKLGSLLVNYKELQEVIKTTALKFVKDEIRYVSLRSSNSILRSKLVCDTDL